MTTSLNVFRAQVDYLISADEDELSTDARGELVRAAVERYSRDAPDEYTEDVSGDGGRYYAISILSNWSEGFSRVVRIEYPAAAVASDETPVYLEPGDWRDDFWAEISGTHTRHIYLPNHAPAATETMRITYTVPYVWTSNATTTPAADFYAICHLAAGLCCQALAAKYARTSDSTIAADSVSHTTRSRRFADRAKEFVTKYESHLRLDQEQGARAAGEFVDWDTAPGWPPGRDYLFHGRDVR